MGAAQYPAAPMLPAPDITVVVSAYNEADRIADTLAALRDAFPGARLLVADDGSRDGTGHAVLQAGAELVRSPWTIGKGGATTPAARRALEQPRPGIVVLCDGDLGESARELPALVAAVRDERCDIAIGTFARRVGGGFGVALRFARWIALTVGGIELEAPLSGQRAMRADVLEQLIPFGPRFGMETQMNIDAARAGYRIEEIELALAHRATGKTLEGFVHRGRQLVDFALVYLDRR
jgi:glycosyltransferase involved in cell wall biosynthesis